VVQLPVEAGVFTTLRGFANLKNLLQVQKIILYTEMLSSEDLFNVKGVMVKIKMSCKMGLN